jgi:hypothetical protein
MRDFTLKLDARKSDKYEITSQGFLVVDANLTRAGVFDYYDKDGKLVRELRSPEEVFKQESLDSLKFAPLTKFHPKEMVDSNNAKRVQVGSIGENIVRKGIFANGKVVINDKKEVDEILAKWDRGEDVELSMGYDAEVVDVAGEHHTDGSYDKMQTNILYNHGSIVTKGRAGSQVKLIMDAEDEAIKLINEKQSKLKKDTEGKKIMKIKREAISIGGFRTDAVLEDVDDSAKGVIGTLEGHIDGAVAVITTMKKDHDELQAKFDESGEAGKKLQARVDELSDPTSAVVQGMIKERADLEAVAGQVDVKVAHEDGKQKDSKTLKVDIISSVYPEFKADDRSDDYITSRCDAIVEGLAADKDSKAAATLGGFRVDAEHSKGKDKKEPREDYLEKVKNLHKTEDDK